jgi:hypothetical protein
MLPAAEASLMRATELAPEQPGPWRDLGVTRTLQQHYGRAAMALRKAFEIDPTDRVTEGMLLHTYGYEAYWKDFPRLRADVVEAARNPADQTSTHTLIVPFPFQAINDDPAIELAVARRWLAFEVLPPSPTRPRRRQGDGRCSWVRVGPARPPGRAVIVAYRAARPKSLRGVRVFDVQGNE